MGVHFHRVCGGGSDLQLGRGQPWPICPVRTCSHWLCCLRTLPVSMGPAVPGPWASPWQQLECSGDLGLPGVAAQAARHVPGLIRWVWGGTEHLGVGSAHMAEARSSHGRSDDPYPTV